MDKSSRHGLVIPSNNTGKVGEAKRFEGDLTRDQMAQIEEGILT